jgi:hypothetical protein
MKLCLPTLICNFCRALRNGAMSRGCDV